MSSLDAPGTAQAVTVEVHIMFTASGPDEAEALLEQVMDAEMAVLCPPDEGRLSPCSHCAGSVVNPADGTEISGEGSPWGPGLPCAVCAQSEFPGQEMACAREHSGGATIHLDGKWATSQDRRLTALLRGLLASMEAGDFDSARLQVLAQLSEVGDPAE